jgi:hypothetical protein
MHDAGQGIIAYSTPTARFKDLDMIHYEVAVALQL